MIRTISKVPTRLYPVITLAFCTACGSGGNSGVDSDTDTTTTESFISNDATATIPGGSLPGGERELLVSDTTAINKTVTQCVCSVRFRSTLQIYHFESKNAVLLIEFDNQSREFKRTANIVLFDVSATADSVSKWINNQHSDGLFFDSAEPLATYPVAPDAISITSSVFVEKLEGESGDEYEQIQIEFTVANLSEPDRYFLNGFADRSVVYLQTR